MATLTLIGEPFPDAESAAHIEATRELTQAIAETAPRGCSARLLVGSDRETPNFSSARARVERLPMRSNVLPRLWRAGMSARPLDGEFVHAPTPLVPLRSRDADDGSQTSVTVPHALGWVAPEAMGSAAAARQYRAFVKRAVRLADVVVTPTHATAAALAERFGAGITVQVIPLAAPTSYLRAPDSDDRRRALGLPPRYIATTATASDVGRLGWLFDALEQDPELPPVVVLSGLAAGSGADPGSGEDETDGEPSATPSAPHSETPSATRASETADGASALSGSETAQETGTTQVISYGAAAKRARESRNSAAVAPPAITVPASVRDRVRIVRPRELSDIGAVLSGAELLAVPQSLIGAGYEELGALAAGVPIVYAECQACDEIALEAGIRTETAAEFAAALSRLARDPDERQRLSVLAEDRSRSFTWATTARLLWELHANI